MCVMVRVCVRETGSSSFLSISPLLQTPVSGPLEAGPGRGRIREGLRCGLPSRPSDRGCKSRLFLSKRTLGAPHRPKKGLTAVVPLKPHND